MTAAMRDAGDFARSLLVQAIWPVAAVAAAILFTALSSVAPPGSFGYGSVIIAAVFGISGLVTILLSANLIFDAFLFRLIASHENEAAGCAAVDDLLARMRLKQRPERPRGLQERITGTRRLMRRQRTALGACVAACLALWLARAA